MAEVVIYDPNSLNPYGLELADLLARNGHAVRFAHSRDLGAGHGNYAFKTVGLARPMSDSGSAIGHLWKRLVDPIRLLWATPKKSALIIVWTRDPWDALLFTFRAILCKKTFFIYHNPTRGRRRRGLGGLGERLLAAHATVCVHSKWLATQTRSKQRIFVTPHPPYSLTGKYCSCPSRDVACSRCAETAERNGVGFIGALRQDKGVDQLAEISLSSSPGWELNIIGSEHLERELPLLDGGRRKVNNTPPSVPISDEEMAAAVARCKVIIAPYTGVTESGSIHLANSVGTPVLGFSSPGLAHVLTDESLFGSAGELGEAIDRFLSNPWQTFIETPQDQDQNCAKAWERNLNFD